MGNIHSGLTLKESIKLGESVPRVKFKKKQQEKEKKRKKKKTRKRTRRKQKERKKKGKRKQEGERERKKKRAKKKERVLFPTNFLQFFGKKKSGNFGFFLCVNSTNFANCWKLIAKNSKSQN